MTIRAGLTPVLAYMALAGMALVLADPALAQTRTDGQKPTTTSAPPPATSAQPTRTAPSTLPIDPGGLSGLPSSGSPTATGSDYGTGGVRTVRPRRTADPAPDTGSYEEIPYVDPPAAPGYESATDAGSNRGAASKPAASRTDAATAPSTPPPASQPASPLGQKPVVAVAPPLKPGAVTLPAGSSLANLPPNVLWIALAGLAAMLVAAGLGLRHILTAPHLSFRVTVDHGVQSAPRFKGAAS